MKNLFTLGLMMLLTASVSYGQAYQTIDFEFDGMGADWTWSVGANGADSPAAEILENPTYDDVNESQTVLKFVAKADGDSWALLVNSVNIGEFTFTADNCIVKMMVLKTLASDISFKVEGGTGPVTTVTQANTLVGQWQEMSFDFTALIGETFAGFVIMPSNTPRTEDLTIYIDNIQLPAGGSTGIEPNSIMDFTVAPNPSNGEFTLQFANDNSLETEVKIFNVAGQVAHAQMVSSSISEINVSELNAGLYFMQVSNENGKNMKKIMIK